MTEVIKNWAPPALVAVPLLGARPLPGLKKGRPVSAGQTLARQERPGRGDRHAPFSGYVENFDSFEVTIRRDDQALGEVPDPKNLRALDRADLPEAARALGLDLPELRPGEPLILSALDPEPGIRQTRALLTEHRDTVLAGQECLRRLFPDRAVIWVVPDQGPPPPEADSFPLPERHPNGLKAVLKKKVLHVHDPEGKGVLNVRELYLWGRVFKTGWPLTHLPLTLGQADYFVPLGSRLIDLLRFANLAPLQGDLVIAGGFFTGRAQRRLERGLGPADQALHLIRRPVSVWPPRPCRGCRDCARVCPAGLPVADLGAQKPEAWMRQTLDSPWDQCFLCGLCAAVCPSRRPLLAVLKMGLARMAAPGPFGGLL